MAKQAAETFAKPVSKRNRFEIQRTASETRGESESTASAPRENSTSTPWTGGEQQERDAEYFDSYGDLQVHELMLRDAPRMRAYVNAITPEDFAGKVVMDVGTGTGFLAMVCATKGEAAHVHAVEANAKLAALATKLVKRNGLEGRVTVHSCAVEELIETSAACACPSGEDEDQKIPREGGIDRLVSEWMGFYLFHESMLDSVLRARDFFLYGGDGGGSGEDSARQNGKMMYPAECRLYTAPLDMAAWHADYVAGASHADGALYGPAPVETGVLASEVDGGTYFADLYGLKGFAEAFGYAGVVPDAGPLTERTLKKTRLNGAKPLPARGPLLDEQFFTSPDITQVVSPDQVLTRAVLNGESSQAGGGEAGRPHDASDSAFDPATGAKLVRVFDLRSITEREPEEIDSGLLRFPPLRREGVFGAVGLWFDCTFWSAATRDTVSVLDCSPFAEATHWRQTVVFLGGHFVPVGVGERLVYRVRMQQSAENRRKYEIELECGEDDADGTLE